MLASTVHIGKRNVVELPASLGSWTPLLDYLLLAQYPLLINPLFIAFTSPYFSSCNCSEPYQLIATVWFRSVLNFGGIFLGKPQFWWVKRRISLSRTATISSSAMWEKAVDFWAASKLMQSCWQRVCSSFWKSYNSGFNQEDLLLLKA